MPTFNQITAGVFCRELVCGLEPLDDLLTSWGLSEDDYQSLRKNEWFQKELLAAVADVRDLGPNSAFIMKCRAIADETLGPILEIIQNTRNDPKVRIDAFKQITDLARLGPPKGESGREGGPSVVFNFGAGLKNAPETLTINPDPTLLPTTNP
jgi:hypothetical protein